VTEFYVLGFEEWGEPHVSGPYATLEEATEALGDVAEVIKAIMPVFVVQRLP